MSIRKSYNSWAAQYDSNSNKTRDLEAAALKDTLQSIFFANCLEIGCGTGKNTSYLLGKAEQVTAVDLSEEMLAKAKEKISSANVCFLQADINQPWSFTNKSFELVSFSLVLEHIENLEPVFAEASRCLKNGGYLYVGELHPFKQYNGSKARFESIEGLHIVECHNHHVSDFVEAAKKTGLELSDLKEYFDEDNRSEVPRILTLLFRKA